MSFGAITDNHVAPCISKSILPSPHILFKWIGTGRHAHVGIYVDCAGLFLQGFTPTLPCIALSLGGGRSRFWVKG